MQIAHIARAANVSYATAWRVLNNHPNASARAAQLVRRAMELNGLEFPAPVAADLNGDGTAPRRRRGRPRKVAHGIRTHNVALLHLRDATAIATTVLGAVQRLLAERDLNLIFAHVDSPDQLPQAVRSGNVDGILGYGQFPDRAEISDRLRHVPAVWMMSRADAKPDPWGDRIKPDHQAIGELAAGVLLDQGHRRLGCMDPDADSAMYRQRLGAFRATARSSGSAADDGALAPAATASPPAGATVLDYAVRGQPDLDAAAAQLVDAWLATPAAQRPTGIFVPVDRVTVRVHRELARRGVAVGRDVQLVSCDNERELLAPLHPAPVSVDLNRGDIARLAVDRLLWRMRNGTSAPQVVVTVSPTVAKPRPIPDSANQSVAPAASTSSASAAVVW